MLPGQAVLAAFAQDTGADARAARRAPGHRIDMIGRIISPVAFRLPPAGSAAMSVARLAFPVILPRRGGRGQQALPPAVDIPARLGFSKAWMQQGLDIGKKAWISW